MIEKNRQFFRQYSESALMSRLVGGVFILAVFVVTPVVLSSGKVGFELKLFILAWFLGCFLMGLFLLNQFPNVELNKGQLQIQFLLFFWVALPWEYIRDCEEIRSVIETWPMGRFARITFGQRPPWYYHLYQVFNPPQSFFTRGFHVGEQTEKYEFWVSTIKQNISRSKHTATS